MRCSAEFQTPQQCSGRGRVTVGPSLVESIETTYDLERRTCAAGEQGRVAHVGFCSVRGLTLSVLRESGRSELFFMSPLLRLCSGCMLALGA